jgi:hypothetical protein
LSFQQIVTDYPYARTHFVGFQYTSTIAVFWSRPYGRTAPDAEAQSKLSRYATSLEFTQCNSATLKIMCLTYSFKVTLSPKIAIFNCTYTYISYSNYI